VSGYWRERFPLWLFVPVAGALAAVAPDRGATRAWLLDSLFALSLLAQFRLWDDLADRAADAQLHPSRVLVRACDVSNYEVLCTALGLTNLLVASLRGPDFTSLGVLIALDAAFGTWYACREAHTPWGDLLLLSKYPMFVLIVAAGPARDLAALVPDLLTVYIAACVFEVVHDPRSPLRTGAAR
jgi:hypothetical protein